MRLAGSVGSISVRGEQGFEEEFSSSSSDPTPVVLPDPDVALGPDHSGPRVAVLLVALTCAFLIATVVRSSSAWAPTTDWALIEAQVRAVGREFPLLGVPSAEGFHHPGPMLYLALAPLYRLFGSDPQALALAAGSLGVMSAAGIGVTAWRRGGVVLVAMTMAVVAWLVGSFPAGTLVDPWNPWVAVLPFFSFLMLVWSVLDGDLVALPFAALVGSFVVQAHVGYVLVVAALGVLCLATVLYVHRTATRDRPLRGSGAATAKVSTLRAGLGAVVVLGVCWVGPVADQLQRRPGNLRRGWWHLGDGTENGRVGVEGALGLTAGAVGWKAPWMGFTDRVEATTMQVQPSSLWHLTLPLALIGLVWWWGRGNRSSLALALTVTVALSVITASMALLESGRAFPYVLRFTWVVAAVLLLAAGWAGVARVLARRPTWSPLATSVGVAFIVIAGVRLVGFGAEPTLPVYQPDSRAAEARCLEQLLPAVQEEVGDDEVHLTMAEFWPAFTAGLFNELERSGATVEVAERLDFFVHRQPSEARPDQVQLVVVDDQLVDEWSARDDVVELAQCDLLDPADRAELDRLAGLEERDAFEGGRLLALAADARQAVVYRLANT